MFGDPEELMLQANVKNRNAYKLRLPTEKSKVLLKSP